jgi:hypothetical protein
MGGDLLEPEHDHNPEEQQPLGHPGWQGRRAEQLSLFLGGS